MKTANVLTAFCLLIVLGCGDNAKNAPSRAYREVSQQPMVQDEGRAAGAGAAADPVPRKIIFTSHLSIVVEDFEEASDKMNSLLDNCKGAYIANSNSQNTPGPPRSGVWTIRVPVAQFRDFIRDMKKLGLAEQDKLDSEDITEKFYDMENRIKNRKVREQTLRQLMEKSYGKLEDIMKIDQELSRVREDIEVNEGQLQRWGKLSELATVHLTLKDRKGYTPPASPDFATTVSRTFHGSVDSLVGLGKGIVLIVVAVTPWIPVLAVVLVPLWILIRRASRQSRFKSAAQIVVLETPPSNPE